jgi:hypothetical protein
VAYKFLFALRNFSCNVLEIEASFKQVFRRGNIDLSSCQVKMWKGSMVTWNAVLDCQRLTGSDFSNITATKTQIEAAVE